MLTALIGGAVAIGVAGASSWITWYFNRGEREATLHEKLAVSAIDRMDRAEKRIDDMEKSWANLRQEIYPHRAWDDRAYRKALEADPDFDPPPPLTI